MIPDAATSQSCRSLDNLRARLADGWVLPTPLFGRGQLIVALYHLTVDWQLFLKEKP